MPTYRFQALGPLPSASGSRTYLGLAVLDESRAEPVVLVWVPEELARDVERSERIQRETERAALLDHPHVVRVYGFARMEEGLARVVEFADGEPLRRILDVTGPLPPALAGRFIADAAQGVHFAHLAGNDDGTPLLHGDLRPQTLLLSFNGHCKVSGYGAAAFAPKENRGRNLFVAPEQVLGGRGAMNVQTDVYLLGLSLYAALTGKAPFEDEAELEQAVLSKPIDVDRPEIPEPFREIITRATAKKAADRYPSALVFREAIELSLPLPDHAEVAAWLNERFPDSDGARADRQRMIDAGISRFARTQWEKQASAPSSQPPFPVVAPPPAPPPATPPAPPAAVAPPP
ncbi:MAG: serine/threonine-protein kinase, partial [Myxococcaceae bacterium]